MLRRLIKKLWRLIEGWHTALLSQYFTLVHQLITAAEEADEVDAGGQGGDGYLICIGGLGYEGAEGIVEFYGYFVGAVYLDDICGGIRGEGYGSVLIYLWYCCGGGYFADSVNIIIGNIEGY